LKILIQHIENLLPYHDCVVVPGLGGFVQNVVLARFDSETDSFYPEGKEICFNARLTFNDGFLAQAYQESFGLSFEESNLQIRQSVQEIKDKIEEGKFLSLGRIGVLWKNDQGQISFRSENKNYFYPESYGLTSFTFPSIDKKHRTQINSDQFIKKHSEKEYINIRLHRNSLRNFLTGAAACLFMVLLPKPAGNLPETNNQEAFMMHNYLVSSLNTVPENVEGEPVEIENLSVLNEVDSISPENIPSIKEKEISAEPVIKTTAPTVARLASNPRTYYIVIGSFPQKGLADDWIRKKGCDTKFRFSGILEKDGRCRVFARSFPEKDVAEAFLYQFRANNPEYASAWLLCAKNE